MGDLHVLNLRSTDVVWLIGDGRSGTTWISNVINHKQKFREIFEPFHPGYVQEVKHFEFNKYVRVGEADRNISRFYQKVFSGNFFDSRSDFRFNDFLKGRVLVKDIFSNLLCCQLVAEFPRVQPVLVLRSPVAVALSKLRKSSWIWDSNPKHFFEAGSSFL